MDTGKILHKWYKAKKDLGSLEKKISEYKLKISREMNRTNTDKISGNGYTVTRRRNNRSYITKENVPESIWKEYSTRCSFDSYYLVRK